MIEGQAVNVQLIKYARRKRSLSEGKLTAHTWSAAGLYSLGKDYLKQVLYIGFESKLAVENTRWLNTHSEDIAAFWSMLRQSDKAWYGRRASRDLTNRAFYVFLEHEADKHVGAGAHPRWSALTSRLMQKVAIKT